MNRGLSIDPVRQRYSKPVWEPSRLLLPATYTQWNRPSHDALVSAAANDENKSMAVRKGANTIIDRFIAALPFTIEMKFHVGELTSTSKSLDRTRIES